MPYRSPSRLRPSRAPVSELVCHQSDATLPQQHPRPFEPTEVRTRFTGLAALVQERIWHPTQKITPLPDGKIDLTLKLTSLEEIERWILSWGAEAEVLEPLELSKRITAQTREMAAQYQRLAS